MQNFLKSFQDQEKSRGVIVEKVVNVNGSTAGAGSGEFHHYRIDKARQRNRLREMDLEFKIDEHKKIREELEKFDQGLTDQRREKRNQQKEKHEQKQQEFKLVENAKSLLQFKNDGSFMDQFLELSGQTTQPDLKDEQGELKQKIKVTENEKGKEKNTSTTPKTEIPPIVNQ